MKDYYEDLWTRLPAELAPPDWELRRRFLLDGIEPGERVLDLGSGAGDFTKEIVRAGARAVGVEVAEAAIARARLPACADRRTAAGRRRRVRRGVVERGDRARRGHGAMAIGGQARAPAGRPAPIDDSVPRPHPGSARRRRAVLGAARRSPAP